MGITLKIKTNYLIISGIALLTMLLGGYYTWCGMGWYKTLILPSMTPPNWVFSYVWTLIYVLTATAAILAFNRFERDIYFYLLMIFFSVNAFLNGYWSYLFFYKHLIGLAFLCAVALECTTIAVFLLIARFSCAISLLLLPYILWNVFAIILNFMIWQLN